MSILTSQEQKQLDDEGYLALSGIVDGKRLAAMRMRLEQMLAVTPQEHAGTLIVGGLIEEAVFDTVWSHPRVLAAVRQVLGPEMLLTGVSSRGLRPGHGHQALHVDWGGQGTPGVWYLCHAICALVDFTAENGATRVVPGSHRNPWLLKGHRDPRQPHPAERQFLGPAGTVFILNVHCAHGAMHNASSRPRLAIFSSFTRPDSPLLASTPRAEISNETLQRHPPEVRALLGMAECARCPSIFMCGYRCTREL